MLMSVVMTTLPTPEFVPVRGYGSSPMISRAVTPEGAAQRATAFSFSAATRNETKNT